MSAKRLSLQSKPLIAVVVVLMAVVVAFNVHTFGGARGARQRAQVRMQSSPPFPLDLDEVVHSSGLEPVAPAAADRALGNLSRDPFALSKQVKQAATTTSRRRRPKQRRKAASSLRCDAVFPGGRAPLALIQGKAYHLGDLVGGYTVNKIDAVGVRLVGGNGKKLFLAVGTENAEQGASRVITTLPAGDRDGRTRLVEYEHSERKIP